MPKSNPVAPFRGQRSDPPMLSIEELQRFVPPGKLVHRRGGKGTRMDPRWESVSGHGGKGTPDDPKWKAVVYVASNNDGGIVSEEMFAASNKMVAVGGEDIEPCHVFGRGMKNTSECAHKLQDVLSSLAGSLGTVKFGGGPVKRRTAKTVRRDEESSAAETEEESDGLSDVSSSEQEEEVVNDDEEEEVVVVTKKRRQR